MYLFIFGIVLLGSSVQPQNAWAYKQEVNIADKQKGIYLHLLQMNRISATKLAVPGILIKPPSQPFKPSSPNLFNSRVPGDSQLCVEQADEGLPVVGFQ